MRAPEVVLEFHAGDGISESEQDQFRADWDALPSLPAVQNGRIYLFLDSFGLRPGPRVALTARKIAELFHPDEEW